MPLLPHVVLDTDTFNEVDDQFALAHLLLSPDALHLDAVYAAPFFNTRSQSPGDGMEKSYEEIHRLLDLVNPATRPQVFRGSSSYLPKDSRPVPSEAVEDLIRRALASKGEKLCVLAIGAATNIASALLAEPRIAENIRIIWLGGHGTGWPDNNEFNLRQDPAAARVLLESPAPLVLLPCQTIASHLITTVAELETHLEPFSKLGADLTHIVRTYSDNRPGWSKVIWDLAASAWMVQPAWVPTRRRPSPRWTDDLLWDTTPHPGGRTIEIAWAVNRDAVFGDFFAKVRNFGTKPSPHVAPVHKPVG